MRHVRAKFRCMNVTRTWDRRTIVELSPVTQRKGNEENEKFWKYTPSGSAKLNFRGPSVDNRGDHFSPGDYYYIDMEKSEEGGWWLSSVTHRNNESGEVVFSTNNRDTVPWGEDGFNYGELSMSLDRAPALSAFDNPGEAWDVAITWAEESDD